MARLARDELILLGIAVVFATVAAGVWAYAYLASKGSRQRNDRLLWAGGVAMVGLAVLIIAVVKSESTQGRPSINAKIQPGTSHTLSATVHESGLATGTTLFVTVFANGREVYNAAIGPDENGTAQLSVTLPAHGTNDETFYIGAEAGKRA